MTTIASSLAVSPASATRLTPAQRRALIAGSMRPVGGGILGAYADRHGRKKGLTLTISLMAAAALLIAICPTYAQIGLLARSSRRCSAPS